MKQKQIILLDLGGVVFQSSGTSNSNINWKVINELNEKHGTELNVGEDKFPDFMIDYNEITNQSLSGNDFLRLVFDTLEINTTLIESLKKIGDIIIVSDNYRENIAYISERYVFESWAIKQYYSFDFQMVKSNPIFFKLLLEDLEEYDKAQMIFIDDSTSKLESAAKNGIEGILFQYNEQVFQALTDLGLYNSKKN